MPPATQAASEAFRVQLLCNAIISGAPQLGNDHGLLVLSDGAEHLTHENRGGIALKQVRLRHAHQVIDDRDIQEAGKKLARHLAQQECLVNEGTTEGTAVSGAELSGIAQIESIQ